MFIAKTFVFSWLCFCHLVGVFGDTEVVKSVTEGDSVTLNTRLTETQKADQILWKFGAGGPLIAKINREFNEMSTYNGTDGRFRDRLKLDNQTGSLTITDTRTTDSGLYEVIIKNSSSEAKYRFSVTVYDSASVTALTAAAGFLLIITAVGIFCIYKKYRQTDQEVQTHTEEITYADPKFYKRNAQKTEVKQEDEAVYARVVRNVDRTL